MKVTEEMARKYCEKYLHIDPDEAIVSMDGWRTSWERCRQKLQDHFDMQEFYLKSCEKQTAGMLAKD